MTPGSPEQGMNALEVILSNKTAALFQILAILPSHILAGALVWAVVTRFGKRPFLASLGLVGSGGLELLASVGLGVVLFGSASLLAHLIGADKPTQLEQIINSSPAARYAIAVFATFTAPFIEELIYRGVLYSALQRVVGLSGAVIIVLGVFTLIHVPQYWPNFGIIAAVGLLSVALTVIRAYTGRLLPCIVIHFVFNGIQSVLLLIQRPAPVKDPSAVIAFILFRLWRLVI
ncbi:MAG: CPBP family intramembrane glutamic endopeptidase [Pyrinomonadaceae bacterium]